MTTEANHARRLDWAGTRLTHHFVMRPEIRLPRPGDARSRRIHEVVRAARAERKSQVSARMWAYRSFEPGGVNVFDFTVSRHRDGPQDFLRDFSGTLLGDCYSGFESIVLASDSRVVRAVRNAHARRKVYEARQHNPLEASQLLALYRRLYDIEDQARGRSAEEVLALRREQKQRFLLGCAVVLANLRSAGIFSVKTGRFLE